MQFCLEKFVTVCDKGLLKIATGTLLQIATVFKPMTTLASIFNKPKVRPPEDRVTGVVHKVECKDCTFSYVGKANVAGRHGQ